MARIMDKWGRSRAQIATELGHGTGATVRRCVINNYKEKDNVKEDYKYVSREFAGRYPQILVRPLYANERHWGLTVSRRSRIAAVTRRVDDSRQWSW